MSHIKIDAADFAEELAWLAKAIGPVFGASRAHVSVEDAAVILRRTDYELFAQSVLPAGVHAVNIPPVLIDPGQLAGLIRGARGDGALELTGDYLSLSCNGRTVRLRSAGDAADYFSDWPAFTPSAAGRVGTPQLARALTSVGTDDTLPMLTGVRFEDGFMLSTNRFHLTRVRYAADGFTAMVPSAVLRAFATGQTVATVEHGSLAVADPAVDGGAVRLSCGGRSVTARVLDAEFPKWRQLIPDTLPVQVMPRRADLLRAIGDADHVTLELRADESMGVTAASNDGGVQISQDIGAVVLAGAQELPLTIRFTGSYLAACLKATPGDVVKLAASGPNRPALLTASVGDDDPRGEDDLHLVMPVRIPG